MCVEYLVSCVVDAASGRAPGRRPPAPSSQPLTAAPKNKNVAPRSLSTRAGCRRTTPGRWAERSCTHTSRMVWPSTSRCRWVAVLVPPLLFAFFFCWCARFSVLPTGCSGCTKCTQAGLHQQQPLFCVPHAPLTHHKRSCQHLILLPCRWTLSRMHRRSMVGAWRGVNVVGSAGQVDAACACLECP